MFPNGPGDLGSILSRVIPKTLQMVLDASLLNTRHYTMWIKGKRSSPGKGVAPSSTLQYSTYWKGSLWVTLDYDWPTYKILFQSSTMYFSIITLSSLNSCLISKTFQLWFFLQTPEKTLKRDELLVQLCELAHLQKNKKVMFSILSI